MKKRIVSLLAIVIALSMALAACAKNDNSSASSSGASSSSASASASGSDSASAAPVPIKVFSIQESGIDLTTNKFSKFIEDKFNIKFDWQLNPSDGAKEKR